MTFWINFSMMSKLGFYEIYYWNDSSDYPQMAGPIKDMFENSAEKKE